MSRLGKITRRAVRDRAILNIARLGLAACSDPFRGFFLPHSVTSSRQCICHQYSSALYWRVQTVWPHEVFNVVKHWVWFFFFFEQEKRLDKGQIWWMMSASCSRQKKKKHQHTGAVKLFTFMLTNVSSFFFLSIIAHLRADSNSLGLLNDTSHKLCNDKKELHFMQHSISYKRVHGFVSDRNKHSSHTHNQSSSHHLSISNLILPSVSNPRHSTVHAWVAEAVVV